MSPEELERERAYYRMKAKIYRETHREEISARQRARYAAMTEDEKEAKRARDREYYARHRETCIATSKSYAAKHRDKIRAYQRERYANNPAVREKSNARSLAHYYNVVRPKRQAASAEKSIKRLAAMGYMVNRPTEEENV